MFKKILIVFILCVLLHHTNKQKFAKMENSKEITRKAWQLILNFRNLRTGNISKLDMRYNINKLVYKKAKELNATIDTGSILQKRKERRIRLNYHYTNSLTNPIVRDYLNNKSDVRFINDERINFGPRNHWAKNEKDGKILNILYKYYTKK